MKILVFEIREWGIMSDTLYKVTGKKLLIKAYSIFINDRTKNTFIWIYKFAYKNKKY